MKKVAVDLLSDVEKTMLMPLWGRYSESIKENGLLYDQKSAELVEEIDFDFSSFEKSQHPLTRLAWVTRAWNTDKELARYAPKDEPFTTVCLGCGLDTTFYRSSHPLMRWIDVDLPDVIELRRELLGTTEGVSFLAGSILDAATFEPLVTKDLVIVLALGLLCYFTELEVKQIMDNISTISPKMTIIMDYFSKAGIEISNQIVMNKDSGVKMIWHSTGYDDLLSLHPGIEVVETYPLFQKIMPHLSPTEQSMAAMSDQKAINSMAILRIS